MYGCLKAPAYLPSGVTVTDIFATVYDNDVTFQSIVHLRRTDNFDGTTDLMATAMSAGTSTALQVLSDSTIDFPNIVYPDYSYYVTTCVESSNIRLYSVRIYFDLPRPDLIVSHLTAQFSGISTRTFDATYRVMNQGQSDAVASTLKFYLSTDTIFSGSDLFIGSVFIPSLAPGQAAPLPSGIFTGRYTAGYTYLIGVADATGTNVESDEGNNVTAVPIM